MFHSKPTHHQMVHSLYAQRQNMEELSRKTGVPVGRLWDAYKNENTKLETWGAKLEEYYYKQFPEGHFSRFVARRDEKLQKAFYKAVRKDPTLEFDSRDKTDLRTLLEDDWTLLSTWHSEEDEPGALYLRARYALMSGWTNLLLEPGISQPDALRRAISDSARGMAELQRTPERLYYRDLMMKFIRLKLSAVQRLHLTEHENHLPVSKALPSSELKDLLDFLLSKVTTWPKGYTDRWQFARDAVTISSALDGLPSSALEELPEESLKEAVLEKCAAAYAILLDERPEFADINHPEWSVGPAADDPDLKFFRENIHTISKIVTTIREKNIKKTSKRAKASLAILGFVLLAGIAVGYAVDLAPIRTAIIVWPGPIKTAIIIWPIKSTHIFWPGAPAPT
jgi:hypothetical protein